MVKIKTALDALEHQNNKSITTFSPNLDKILGGGINLGVVTEICGMAGVGKTQICLQLCANVQIPECCGGLGGSAYYFDTEGSFVASRMKEIATATAEYIRMKNNTDTNIDSNHILSNIGLFRITSIPELLSSIEILEQELIDGMNIKLLVIDSLAFHFRSCSSDMAERSRLLNSLAQTLRRLASQYKLSIILTNQMTTKILSGENRSIMVPGFFCLTLL